MNRGETPGTGPARTLTAVMYHYVRDLPHSRFPRIKGMLTDDFRRQVGVIAGRYELATVESALAFLAGSYSPARDLCLLTFDDGLKEHYADVTPVLAERHIQGLFFLPTACLEESRVAAVHKSHFLMAAMEFAEYREEFLRALARLAPGVGTGVDPAKARATYRWDDIEVAQFKYLLNFNVPANERERILEALFADHLGDERAFARELYVSWQEAQNMQAEGMVMGGHSHNHVALSTMDDAAQDADIHACAALLRARLSPQDRWPFSFPYGKKDSFTPATVTLLRECGFELSFTTEVGSNGAGTDPFAIRRIDAKDVPDAHQE